MIAEIYAVGIAIDMQSDHLYWADHIDILFRSDLDGSNRTEILNGLSCPYAVALDTVNKLVCHYYISVHEFESLQ